jgi:hypothetical protein
MKHVLSTLGTDFAKFTRSERIEEGATLVKGNSAAISAEVNLAACAGDRVLALRNLLNAYTFKGKAKHTNTTGHSAVLRIYPSAYSASATNALVSDLVDYCMSGFAFFKGGFNIRLVSSENGSLAGQVMLLNAENPVQGEPSSAASGSGWSIYTKNGTYTNTAGTRLVPVFDLENAPDFNVPYYQPFHMNRIYQDSLTGKYEGGKIAQYLLYKPTDNSNISVDIYRAVRDDFRLGFLTSLPIFVVNSNFIV